MSYFLIFLQSNLLELPVAIPFVMRRNTFFTSLVLTTCLNAVTHPIIFFFVMNLKMTFLFNILAAETFAILSEAFCYRIITRESVGLCLLISLCANFFSWQISPMITFALN